MNGKRLMAEFNIYGLGELLWDELPEGRRAGGAPSNFAYIATQLGDRGTILSRVGNDADGDDLITEIADRGLDVSMVQSDEVRPTGAVKVKLINGEPEYEIGHNAAWDGLELTENWRRSVSEADAIAFGTLGQRSETSRRTIRGLLRCAATRAIRFVDLNLREGSYSPEIVEHSLESANAAKLNQTESDYVCKEFGIEGRYEAERLNAIRERFGLDVICLTRGSSNSLILTDSEMSDQEIRQVDVVDVIGAGDAFSAGLVHGLLRGWEIDRVNRFAGQVGTFVATRAGAMPDFAGFR